MRAHVILWIQYFMAMVFDIQEQLVNASVQNFIFYAKKPEELNEFVCYLFSFKIF